MMYKELEPIDREQALAALASKDFKSVCDALLRLTLFEPDWRWAQDRCLSLYRHQSLEVRSTVATCFGHLARIHGKLDLHIVIPVLEQMKREAALRGVVDDSFDDINMYTYKN